MSAIIDSESHSFMKSQHSSLKEVRLWLVVDIEQDKSDTESRKGRWKVLTKRQKGQLITVKALILHKKKVDIRKV